MEADGTQEVSWDTVSLDIQHKGDIGWGRKGYGPKTLRVEGGGVEAVNDLIDTEAAKVEVSGMCTCK